MEHRLKGEIPVQIAHRKFLAGIGAEAAATVAAPLRGQALMTATPPRVPMDSFTSSQKTGQPHIMNWVAVINDEISQDFGRACEVALREFGMQKQPRFPFLPSPFAPANILWSSSAGETTK